MKKLLLLSLLIATAAKVGAWGAQDTLGVLPQTKQPVSELDALKFLTKNIRPDLPYYCASFNVEQHARKGKEMLKNKLNRLNKASGYTFFGKDSIVTDAQLIKVWATYFFLATPKKGQVMEMIALTPEGKFIIIKRFPYPGEQIWVLRFEDGSTPIGMLSNICLNTIVSDLPNLHGKRLRKRGEGDEGGTKVDAVTTNDIQKQVFFVGNNEGGGSKQPIIFYVQGGSVTNSGNSASKGIGGNSTALSMPNRETGLQQQQQRYMPLTVSTTPAETYTATATSPVYTRELPMSCSSNVSYRRRGDGTTFRNVATGIGVLGLSAAGIMYSTAALQGKLQPRTFVQVLNSIFTGTSGTTTTGGSGGPAPGITHY